MLHAKDEKPRNLFIARRNSYGQEWCYIHSRGELLHVGHRGRPSNSILSWIPTQVNLWCEGTFHTVVETLEGSQISGRAYSTIRVSPV